MLLILASIIMLIIELIVIFAFIGYYRMLRSYHCFSAVRTKRVKISDIYDSLKTGDIILFVASSHSPSNSIITQTFYSHASMVVKLNGSIYLSESVANGELAPEVIYKTRKTNGVAVIDKIEIEHRTNYGADLVPLLTKLKYYTGCFYIMPLNRDISDDSTKKIENEAINLYKNMFPYPSTTQIMLNLVVPHKVKKILGICDTSRHCFQHVAYLLANSGAVNEKFPIYKYLSDNKFVDICKTISSLDKYILSDDTHYLSPSQIIYDIQ